MGSECSVNAVHNGHEPGNVASVLQRNRTLGVASLRACAPRRVMDLSNTVSTRPIPVERENERIHRL